VEERLGRILIVGVVIAATVVFIGGFLFLLQHSAEPVAYGVFHGEPDNLRTIQGIFHLATQLDPRGVIQFGLLLLIATPIARVAAAAAGFAFQRDWLYTGIACGVLAILGYGLLSTLHV
jgi:uncharacterized membrane protein